jgi:hypothetical protein
MPEILDGTEQQLKSEALTVVQRARTIVVSDQASYDSACDLLLSTVIPFRKRWSDFWKPMTEAAWKAYKTVQIRFKEGDEPLEEAEKAIKKEIRRWDDEQQKIEAERQRRAQEEAEKAAEEERLRAAIVAEEAGATETEVSAIVDAPVAVVAEPVAPAYQRTSGISKRENWKCKVNDLHALVKAAAKDKSLMAYLQPDQRALDARAKADRQTLNLPGCVAYNDAVISARGR